MKPVRVYRGRRGPTFAVVTVDGEILLPDGQALSPFFDWGAASPGASALARALLLSHLGTLPARSVLHRFTFQVIGTWSEPQWTTTTADIDTALGQIRQQLQIGCLYCADTGRREIQQRLWRICECQPRTIPPDRPAA